METIIQFLFFMGYEKGEYKNEYVKSKNRSSCLTAPVSFIVAPISYLEWKESAILFGFFSQKDFHKFEISFGETWKTVDQFEKDKEESFKALEETEGFIGLLINFKIRVAYVVESDYKEIARFDTFALANAFGIEYSKTTTKPVVVIRKYVELEI